MTPKIARFAPRQIATVASAVIVNAGALQSWRKAKRRLYEQTNSAHKVVTYSNADIAVFSLVIDSELELTFVLSAVEVAFRFCDESVVVDPPKFVAADAKAFSRAARSGIRSS